ncbi:vitellin-degrading protease-like, partial [Hyposmocoma kahamanoa]|uniref:vitellin-degrading protease-like n=1 Tax=Hyposmocoma kahamanoa TaxID=1477025 RepID=UPI000E6D79AD
SCNIEDQVQKVDPTRIVNTGSRIVGGSTTTILRYPFAVQVFMRDILICGGSLITRQMVLTSSTCLHGSEGLYPIFHFRVLAGATYSQYLSKEGKLTRVERLAVHEQYDIAILRTVLRFTLGPRIGLAFIPSQDSELPDGSTLTHIGWGSRRVGSRNPSPVLYQVHMYKLNKEMCNILTENMLCSGIPNVTGVGPCHRDEGAPVLYDSNIVVGVTPWVANCGTRDYGVYTRVAKFTTWIDQTVLYLNGSSSVSISRIILLVTLICTMLSAS